MERYVAFLRGMNLGKRRIKNDELRAEFETLGFEDVATFRASGNVIFVAAGKSEGALTKKIEHGLGEALGYEVPVFLRSGAEVAAIAAQKPFPAKEIAASKGKLQVTMLAKVPTAAARRKVLELATGEDSLEIAARELFWLPSGGTLESELDHKEIEEALGKGTQRTMGTIEQIAAKHC
ncbi:MAG TPA: DUF1697 domain-containing protein [Solirubrobacterales bacterium]|jgi:uncharacterized protein (DUF1697 family)|nr:DUF1697 domain-containing protein [Solirubrobacterales bacterium]